MRKFSAEVHKSFQVRIIMHMQFNTSSILLRLNMLRYYSMHKCDSKYVSTKFDHAWALKAKCKCNTNFEPTQSILINCRRHFDGLRRNRQFQPSRPECLSLKGKVWQKWIEVQNVTRINCDQNKSSVAGRLVFEGNTDNTNMVSNGPSVKKNGKGKWFWCNLITSRVANNVQVH